jgi:hypothetical protein
MLQQLYDELKPHWHELGAISYFLLRIWILKRQRRWLRKHSELEGQRVIASSNETLRIVSTAYASGEPQTLGDLLSHAERDWSLRSSQPPSEEEPTRTTRPPPRESSYQRLVPPPPPIRRR